MMIESVFDRLAIEQNFHDVEEVRGAGEQQVRNVWCHVARWILCLCLHTMVKLWSWKWAGKTLGQRTGRLWDERACRPRHPDCLKTRKKHLLRETFSVLPRRQRVARKIPHVFQGLARLVNGTTRLSESAGFMCPGWQIPAGSGGSYGLKEFRQDASHSIETQAC